MAKKKPSRNAAVPTPAELAAQAEPEKPAKHPSARGGRETIDALAVAVVLALLIRTFQAEAFVIPTGSMAPTLMGKHKDVCCDQCGQRFKVNASAEDGDEFEALEKYLLGRVQRREITPQEARRQLRGVQAVGGSCPQCGYLQPIRTDDLEDALPEGVEPVSTKSTYSGDRLVVNKYQYSFSDPERWDIAVFKYPGKAQTNYIKRLVGLPGESLRIVAGDLQVRDGDAYAIAYRPPETMLAMSQHVHDTDHDPASLHDAGWPLRWSGDEAWRVQTESAGKLVKQAYSVEASDAEEHWLRYRHTIPKESVWEAVLAGQKELNVEPKPSLVTDYIAYNARILREKVEIQGQFTRRPRRAINGREELKRQHDGARVGVHWVGDLMLDADVRVESPSGELLLELVEAGDGFGCRIDVATGRATFYRRGFETTDTETLGSAETAVRGGTHRLRLANYDDRLILWVDDEPIDAGITYDAGSTPEERVGHLPRTSEADEGDLAPARIGVRGAAATITRLRLRRDIYYLADSWRRADRTFVTDYDIRAIQKRGRNVWLELLNALPERPEAWNLLASRQHADFELGEDQFFVMGDNSPESLDARLWYGGGGRDPGRPGGSYLERDLLVGKAVCVYWPHAWYSIPLGPVGLPIVPNLPDMRLVR